MEDVVKNDEIVRVVAEPVPFERDNYQLFMNALVTRADGKKLYIPHVLVDTGMSEYYETSELEGLYGAFPVAFEARVVQGIDWERETFDQHQVVVEYTGEDFWDVEPFEDPDQDTAYFREWNTWLVADRCHYYPVLEA
jgi:hypothetical protein